MTDDTPRRRRRHWLIPVLVLGAGAWVLVRRRGAEPPEVWAQRPPVVPSAAPPSPALPSPARPVPVVAAPSAPETLPGPETLLDGAQPLVTAPFGPGSAAPLADGSAPGPEFTIKGNTGSRLFHPPSSPYYRRTRAEVWFRTAEDALAAGFTPHRARSRAKDGGNA